MKREKAGRKCVIRDIWALCYLCLHVDYIWALPLLRIMTDIITLSQCIQYFAVEFGVVWSVEVAEIMRTLLRTAGQSCDGSEGAGEAPQERNNHLTQTGRAFTFKESCCSSCLRWISVHGVPLTVSGTGEHRFVQQTLCRPHWDTMASG